MSSIVFPPTIIVIATNCNVCAPFYFNCHQVVLNSLRYLSFIIAILIVTLHSKRQTIRRSKMAYDLFQRFSLKQTLYVNYCHRILLNLIWQFPKSVTICVIYLIPEIMLSPL